MNRAERLEADKRKHEYDLMDRRLGEQRVIDEVTERFNVELKPLKKRVTSLEHWRTGLVSGWFALVAWWKYGNNIKI